VPARRHRPRAGAPARHRARRRTDWKPRYSHWRQCSGVVTAHCGRARNHHFDGDAQRRIGPGLSHGRPPARRP
jgi:hypothetical protein